MSECRLGWNGVAGVYFDRSKDVNGQCDPIDVCEQIESERDELRKDKARMDFLDRPWVKVSPIFHGTWISDKSDVAPDMRGTTSAMSLREWIDEKLVRAAHEATESCEPRQYAAARMPSGCWKVTKRLLCGHRQTIIYIYPGLPIKEHEYLAKSTAAFLNRAAREGE